MHRRLGAALSFFLVCLGGYCLASTNASGEPSFLERLKQAERIEANKAKKNQAYYDAIEYAYSVYYDNSDSLLNRYKAFAKQANDSSIWASYYAVKASYFTVNTVDADSLFFFAKQALKLKPRESNVLARIYNCIAVS